MAHLSSYSAPWGKPFTNKRYLHPPYAENIITMWPSSMIMISELTEEKGHEWVITEKYGRVRLEPHPAAAVIFTLKREDDDLFRFRDREPYRRYLWQHDFMPFQQCSYRTRKDGIPIHAFTKEMDAVRFHQESFCDQARVPTAYIRITIENGFGRPQQIELGTLIRTGPEFLLTGCPDPDGYAGYNPQRAYWEADEIGPRYSTDEDHLTDGTYRLYFDPTVPFLIGGKNDLTLPFTLEPFEKKTLTFAFTRNQAKPESYERARRKALSFWKNELSKARHIPNKSGIAPLFNNFLSQMLQMFACPIDADHTIIRQGALQRYHWPEAKEVVNALSQIGGYSDYLERALDHYFFDLQEKDGADKGRIFNRLVPWNSRTAAALSMLAAAESSEPRFYDKYIENAMEGFRWIERERAKSANIPHCHSGLFPPGIASDNHCSEGQQWKFADTENLRSYERFIELLKKRNSPYSAEVQAAYDDYFKTLKSLFDYFAEKQADSEFLFLPHDPRNLPELEKELNKHGIYFSPGCVLASGIAGYGTKDAEKLLYFYSGGNQSSHHLVDPIYRSVTGTGRTWYTTWPEHDQYQYHKKCGNRKQCKKLLDALLKYNVTTEYLQPERIDDHDAYFAPWMPNASANGRVLDMLFDYYGKKDLH